MNLRQKINVIFTKSELKKVFLLFVGILIMGLLEVVGVTAIVPFIAVVVSPELIYENIYLSEFYNFFHFHNFYNILYNKNRYSVQSPCYIRSARFLHGILTAKSVQRGYPKTGGESTEGKACINPR